MFIVNWGEIIGRLDPSSFKKTSVFESQIFEMSRLGKVVEINPTITYPSTSPEMDISFVPMELIDENLGEIKTTLTKKLKENKGYTKFQENDLLWAKITPCMQNGKSAIAQNLINGFGCGSTEFYIVRPKTDNILIKYIHFILRDNRVLKNAENFFGGSAGQQRVSKDFLKHLLIPVPPLFIQQQVVDIMEAAYSKKQQKEKEAEELLGNVNSYLLDELDIVMPLGNEITIENKMFYVGANDVIGSRFDPFYHKQIFINIQKSLDNGKYNTEKMSRFISHITYGASVDNCYVENGIPLLRIKDLKPNEIDSEKIVYLPYEMEKQLKTSRVKKGEILISRSGTIGICSVVHEKYDGFAFGSFMIKFSVEEIDKNYLCYVLNSNIGKMYFERNRIGTIQGNITIPTIKNIVIPVPPIEKQQEIAFQITKIRKNANDLKMQADEIVAKAKAEVESILLGDCL